MRWPAWRRGQNQNEEAAVATAAASSVGNGRSGEGPDTRAGSKVPLGRPMRPFGDGSSSAAAGSLPTATRSSGLFGSTGGGNERTGGEARSTNAWRDSGGELSRPARPLSDRYGSGGGSTKGGRPSGWMPDMTYGAGASSSSSSNSAGAARWAIPPPPEDSTLGHTGNAASFPGGEPPVKIQQWDKKDKSEAFPPMGDSGLRSGAASAWPERPNPAATGSSFGGAAAGHVHTDENGRGRGGGGATTAGGLVTGGGGGEQRQGVFGGSTFSGLDGSAVPRGERPLSTPFGAADTRVDSGDEEDEDENPFA